MLEAARIGGQSLVVGTARMRDVPAGPEEAAALQPALARYKVAEATDGTQFRKKARQLIQQQRLWADLLSSQPMCFNLFGELAADLELAGGGRPWRPTALSALTVTAAIGVALLPPAAARHNRR
jgi:hypothetical protein